MAESAAEQLAAVGRFFERLAGKSERLVYRTADAAAERVVDARGAFGVPRHDARRGGEALAA